MTRVVIVDDQAINLKILCQFAQSLEPGIDVRPFANALDALAFLSESVADLIVTDYVMPHLDGAEFIRRCRQIPSLVQIPIIVVTAYEDREFRYRALEAGASDFLISPADGQEFCSRARNLLTLRRQQALLEERALSLESELATKAIQHAEEIRAREEHLRRVVDTVPALIRASDLRGRIVLANSYHRRFFAIDREQAAGCVKEDVFAPEYAARHRDLERQMLEGAGFVGGIEETVCDVDGSPRVMLTTKAPLRDSAGVIDQIVTVSLDITERKQVEQAVIESEARFRSLVEGSVLGIVIERDGRPVFANRTYARIFGYDTPEEILALPNLDSLFAPGEIRLIHRLKSSGLWGREPAEAREFQGRCKDGSLIWVEILTQEVRWEGLPALQSTVADISLRKAYEEQLQRQANYDEVTNLPNRALALDRLRRAVVSALRHRHKGGVLFIDLDHFKKINDTWGHAVGDQLLRLAAERLLGCVREEDTVARLGGDEFTIILPKLASALHIEPVVNKVLNAFSQPFLLDHHECFVTASIGVAVFPDDSDEPAVLMQSADAAMYRAKEQGRSTFQCFTPELNERALRRMRIEGQLVHAVDRDEFLLHFQPIVDVRTGLLVGAEALLRWANADLGLLEPDMFIALAEDTGLIIPVGRWVLDAACREVSRWRDAGLPNLRVSVNISSRQLRGKGLVEAAGQALQRHGLRSDNLELEITEGCLMDDLGDIAATLRALAHLGVSLALDDFGTGYSCLSHLKAMPVNTVKIDKSFILNVADDPGDAPVVEAIIAMAHRLGMRVVGEGVETEAQLAFIRDRDCDLAQGYYFGEPMPAEGFVAWYHRLEHGTPVGESSRRRVSSGRKGCAGTEQRE